MVACEADPAGGEPWRYSYGNELDLDACNTRKAAKDYNAGCDPRTGESAYKTCGTHTEPSGSFPSCRSRFGVFDLQGNFLRRHFACAHPTWPRRPSRSAELCAEQTHWR